MKAILIFNIDGTDINDIHFYAMPILESTSGKEFKATSDLILRPLPEKKSIELACKKEAVGNDYGAGLIVGWNDCLEEMLGETE